MSYLPSGAIGNFGFGINVIYSTTLDDGKMMMGFDGSGSPSPSTLFVGVYGEDSPQVIARKLVRENMREVLAWLDKPPNMLTGREVIDKLAGRPVWSAKRCWSCEQHERYGTRPEDENGPEPCTCRTTS